MPEQRVNPRAVWHLFWSDAESGAVEHCHIGLWERRGFERAGDLLAQRRADHLVRIAEQVVGREESVGLASPELGLHPVNRSGGGVAGEAVADLDQSGLQGLCEVGLAREDLGVEIVLGALAPGDESQVGGEERLVEGAVADVGVRPGYFEPWSQVGHGSGAFLIG